MHFWAIARAMTTPFKPLLSNYLTQSLVYMYVRPNPLACYFAKNDLLRRNCTPNQNWVCFVHYIYKLSTLVWIWYKHPEANYWKNGIRIKLQLPSSKTALPTKILMPWFLSFSDNLLQDNHITVCFLFCF